MHNYTLPVGKTTWATSICLALLLVTLIGCNETSSGDSQECDSSADPACSPDAGSMGHLNGDLGLNIGFRVDGALGSDGSTPPPQERQPCFMRCQTASSTGSMCTVRGSLEECKCEAMRTCYDNREGPGPEDESFFCFGPECSCPDGQRPDRALHIQVTADDVPGECLPPSRACLYVCRYEGGREFRSCEAIDDQGSCDSFGGTLDSYVCDNGISSDAQFAGDCTCRDFMVCRDESDECKPECDPFAPAPKEDPKGGM